MTTAGHGVVVSMGCRVDEDQFPPRKSQSLCVRSEVKAGLLPRVDQGVTVEERGGLGITPGPHCSARKVEEMSLTLRNHRPQPWGASVGVTSQEAVFFRS